MLKKTLTKNIYDCRAVDLVDIVADVKSYTEFIPFCSNVDIYDRFILKEKEYFSARLLVNFKFTNETFLTKVVVNRNLNSISITGNNKPFKSLIAAWSFIEHDNFCSVSFSMEASFSSFLKEKLVSISFEKVAFKIIEAFERRAKE